MKCKIVLVLLGVLCLATGLSGQQTYTATTEVIPTSRGQCPASLAGGNTSFDPCVYLTKASGVSPGARLSGKEPNYVKSGQQTHVTGTVVLAVAVNEAGTVDQVRVLRHLEPTIDKSATEVVKSWTFKPATRNGKPTGVQFLVEVKFDWHQ